MILIKYLNGTGKHGGLPLQKGESYSVLDFLTLSAEHEGLEMTVFAILIHLLQQTTFKS